MNERPPAHPRSWWSLLKESVSAWSDDYAPSMGAALSYYSVFSMAPLLMIVISIAGLVFGEQAARGEVFDELRGLMGDEPARAVEALLSSLSKPSHGITSTLISLAVLLVGATSVFAELQNALDRIWRAPPRSGVASLWRLVRTRLVSFGLILGIAFLLMVFSVGRFLIGFYIGRSGVASGFGAAASVAIIFVWVYYSAQIFLLGAEFTRAYSMRCAAAEN